MYIFFKAEIIFQDSLTCFSSRREHLTYVKRHTSNNYSRTPLVCFPITFSPHISRQYIIIMHNHFPSNVRPFPQILATLRGKRLPINHTRSSSFESPSILKKKKKRNTPNYNLIYHPEAGIIFHLSPNPPYSPLPLFPSPPSIVITHRLEMDPSRVSRSHVTVNDPRQPRRSLTPVRRADGQFTFRQRRLSSGRCERKLDGPPCRVPHFSLFLGITCLRTCNYGRSHRGFEKCRAITERSSLACYEV